MNCSQRYRAAHDSGVRPLSAIEYIVIHDEECSTDEGAAQWFANPRSGGSAHVTVDDDSCFETLPADRIPWAAPPMNTSGYHIELAGFARYSRAEWLSHMPMLKRAAQIVAERAQQFKIPVRRVDVQGLRLGHHGITDHRSISEAFHRSTHTDPGPNFPWDVFMRLVRAHSDRQEASAHPWPRRIPKWFWAWARWRLAGRKWRRPGSAPKQIPAWAWRRLRPLARARRSK